jgi:hypothetical protein
MFGYGLARYAWLRGEADPGWARYVDTNPRTFVKRGLRYLKQAERIVSLPHLPRQLAVIAQLQGNLGGYRGSPSLMGSRTNNVPASLTSARWQAGTRTPTTGAISR